MTRGIAGAVATLAGFAVMCLELTAVRILAPHFGDSAHVWTNVIGVMLVALAVGAWFGGKLADAERGPRRLAALFTVAGLLTALVPLLATPMGSWLLPQSLPLDAAMAALVRGSLVATLLLFAPAVTLVGCMTPMLVSALVGKGSSAGSASGLVAATSTLGSLLGTFAATHVLVPEFGSRATIWLCAGAILVCALLVRPSARTAASLLLPAALLPWGWGQLRATNPGEQLLAEVESRYQYLQVVRSSGEGGASVALKINEGLDSFHSIALENSAFTGGRYYDYHAVAPFLLGKDAHRQSPRVLSLGAAAGTFSRLFAAAHPGCSVDGVEIDPAVVELGEEYFGGRPGNGRVFSGLDARVFVERASGPYDVVLVDCYERQIYVPAHVASREFFASVARILAPGGVVSVNSGGRTFDDPVVKALARTMAAVFGEAQAFRIPDSRNFMLMARKGQALDPTVLRPGLSSHPDLQRVLQETALPGAWRRYEPGEPVLDDDRPLLDTLQERSLGRNLGLGGVLQMGGGLDPETAADRATEQLGAQRDYDGALATLRQAREPSVRLRLLAGDARWRLHDLDGALLEYQDALANASPEWLEFAQGRVALAREELGPWDEAAAVGARNGWLAALVALLFATTAAAAAVRFARA